MVGKEIGTGLLGAMVPACGQAYTAEIRSRIRDDLGQLGFALVAYHADHAAYPDTLDDLTPNYISAVPRNLYNEQELHFVRTTEGYLLYSFGANGMDDHGQSFDSEPKGDDIVLRITHKAVQK